MKFLIFSFLVFLSLQSCAFDAPMDNLEVDNSGEDSLFFANRLMKNFQEKVQEAQQKPPKESKAKPANKMGEYIDYEEID